jgi:DNA-binding MltR family transcriptional regulator
MTDPSLGDLSSRLEDLYRSDAGHVILSVALADQSLEMLILASMPRVSNSRARKLFTHRGPLGSLTAKMNYAYALDLIDSKTCAELKALNQVRNAFAHPRRPLRFKGRHAVKHFKAFEEWHPDCDLRVLFDENVTRALGAINAKIDGILYADATK